MLVIASLLLAALAGYQQRTFGASFKLMLLSITVFCAVIILLYVGSYVLTTTFLADKMVWILFILIAPEKKGYFDQRR